MPTEMMRAVRCYGFGGQHRFENAAPVPEPAAEEVLVRVNASGICAADRAMYERKRRSSG